MQYPPKKSLPAQGNSPVLESFPGTWNAEELQMSVGNSALMRCGMELGCDKIMKDLNQDRTLVPRDLESLLWSTVKTPYQKTYI